MSYRVLATIEELVHHLWDAGALYCLEGRPLRYTELHQTIAEWSGNWFSESELTRTRRRLLRRGLISEELSSNGRKVYALTAAGRVRLDHIRALAEFAEYLDGSSAARHQRASPVHIVHQA
jgi:DNA-binding PadR family transcriptional regulator